MAAYIAGIFNETVGANNLPVLIDTNGKLGTAVTSSRRFKNEIKAMDKASEAILALKPVTFHYKDDKTNTPQFGLIAEEVAEVNRDLVVRDKHGQICAVRYDAVNAMLLSEFLKEHRTFLKEHHAFLKEQRKVDEQEATIAQLRSIVAQQQKGMEALAASVKEQASQIQKVSAKLETRKPVPEMVFNDR
jgi:methyl-accepting chemotaxis protein